MAFDEFGSHFCKILQLGEEVITSETSRPSLSMDMEGLHALLAVAGLCRHPVLRRDAVAFMQKVDCQEETCNGSRLVKFANHMMEMEEHGLRTTNNARDVLESVRLTSHKIVVETSSRICHTVVFWIGDSWSPGSTTVQCVIDH